jgi:uracil-DNA glycosylase
MASSSSSERSINIPSSEVQPKTADGSYIAPTRVFRFRKTNSGIKDEHVQVPNKESEIIEESEDVDKMEEPETQIEGARFGLLWKQMPDIVVPEFQKPIVRKIGKLRIIQRAEITQDMSICDIVIARCPEGWEELFYRAWSNLISIDKFLAKEERKYGMYFPLKKDIFKAFELTSLKDVKVVIIGQDPYHSVDDDGNPTAQGLSFSVRRGSRVAPSLQNIYKVLKRTIPGFEIPRHGDLTYWAKQGVLLLNKDLTVRPHLAKSHPKSWMGFINLVMQSLISFNKNTVYMLWGRPAQELERCIGNGHILKTGHPSPMSFHKYGFKTCNHFNEANDILRESGQTPIDWQIPL